MAQCQPSNAFGYITKSPSYSPFISNCLENKLINTSMIFPEKSEKSRETSPTSPMKFPRFGTPLPWKNHPMIPMMKNDMSRSRPPDWMWTWKLDFFYPPKKLFWKVKWYNPVNLWLHEISDNKKNGGYFTISFISKSWRNWGSNSCWPWLNRSRPRRALRSRVWWSRRPPSTTLAPLITPYKPLHNHDEPHIKPPSSKLQKDTER